MLERRKRKQDAFVQTKEYDEDAYERATDKAEDEELERGFVSEDVQRLLDEQAMQAMQTQQNQQAMQTQQNQQDDGDAEKSEENKKEEEKEEKKESKETE